VIDPYGYSYIIHHKIISTYDRVLLNKLLSIHPYWAEDIFVILEEVFWDMTAFSLSIRALGLLEYAWASF
jgi:hypothetical protein